MQRSLFRSPSFMVCLLLCLCVPGPALAEGKSAAASLGVYVFPAANQAAEQQATDESTATNRQPANFKKAFGACLEGKQYTVKF